MKETQFTPGPWEVLFPPSANSCGFIAAADGEEIAVITNFSDVRHCGLPDIANGNLIAAAPALYDSLKDILSRFEDLLGPHVAGQGNGQIDGDAEAVQVARAAIAKATGDAE